MPGRNYLSLFVVALLALGVAACGGGDDEPTTTAAQEAPGGADGKAADKPSSPSGPNGKGGKGGPEGTGGQGGSGGAAASDFKPKSHDDSGGGSEQFRVKGGDNSVQEFGTEAEGSEFEEGAAALHNFLDARAEQNWAAACKYLVSAVAKSLGQAASQATKGEASSCAVGLEKLTNPQATQILRREAAQADVGSVRTEAGTGFAIYRVGGTTYAISMAIEDGVFKVAALAGLPLN